MTVVFVASLIAGLLVGVRIMIFGVERERMEPVAGEEPAEADSRSGTAGSAVRFSLPVVAGFCVVFGVVGYVVLHAVNASPFAATIAGAASGSVSAALAAWGVRRSADAPPTSSVQDERYVLQGMIARVVRPIGGEAMDLQYGMPRGEGEIAFEVEGTRRVLRARTVRDDPADVGTEVVIERIENGVAIVEPWFQVEKRL